MKPKDADLVLSYFADFAHTNPNDPRLEKMAMQLINIVAGISGLHCCLEPNGDIELKHSVELHELINRHLKSLSDDNGVNSAIYLEGGIMVQSNLGGSGDRPGVFLDLRNTGIRGVIFAMFYCCGAFGAKKVVRCAGCGKYVFVAGHHRKYCRGTNRCRQRAHRLKKTPEDIKRENAKRRAEYGRRKSQ